MKIETIRAVPVSVPLDHPSEFARGTMTAFDNGVVRIETDEGVVGYGESAPLFRSQTGDASAVGGRARADGAARVCRPGRTGGTPEAIRGVRGSAGTAIPSGGDSAREGAVRRTVYHVGRMALALPDTGNEHGHGVRHVREPKGPGQSRRSGRGRRL